ncbi:hypothetical protein [Rhodococcus qingshengii]|uniref:hypothetical protein n=1 Tax=Rhodococcus qingshengii TaxID=334542 RepID=UPI001BE8599D|nr:hypothetical protein [Rhodococcus qingshengii]MBT2271932.1 hypothetical protein [Rhodococcus qingshengii]
MKSGRTVAEAASVSMSPNRRSTTGLGQELIDTGQKPRLSSIEGAALDAARRRIAELETELAIA